jgi:hypothetical protein
VVVLWILSVHWCVPLVLSVLSAQKAQTGLDAEHWGMNATAVNREEYPIVMRVVEWEWACVLWGRVEHLLYYYSTVQADSFIFIFSYCSSRQKMMN